MQPFYAPGTDICGSHYQRKTKRIGRWKRLKYAWWDPYPKCVADRRSGTDAVLCCYQESLHRNGRAT
eukprot:1009804-Rhodomonas_salina.11